MKINQANAKLKKTFKVYNIKIVEQKYVPSTGH